VFCAPWQVRDEIVRGPQAVRRCYRLLGIDVARYRLSRRGSGDGYLGGAGLWGDAERQLAGALDDLGLDFRTPIAGHMTALPAFVIVPRAQPGRRDMPH
jgi:threonyl-tRNA synthetase